MMVLTFKFLREELGEKYSMPHSEELGEKYSMYTLTIFFGQKIERKFCMIFWRNFPNQNELLILVLL